VTYEGFKSLRDVELRLTSRLSVLIGANGSGKSSMLEGAHLVGHIVSPQPDEAGYGDGPAAIAFRDQQSVADLVTHADGVANLRLEMRTLTDRVWLAAAPSQGGANYSIGYGSDDTSVPDGAPGDASYLRALRAHGAIARFGGTMRLHLDSRRAAAPSYNEDEEPWLERDGSGLASALSWLSGNHRHVLDAIESDLAQVVPGTGAIRTPRVKLDHWEEKLLRIEDEYIPRRTKRRVAADTIEVEFGRAGFLPIQQLSDGTILALALLTVLHSPSCPRLVLLDDLDRGLHPKAQEELVGCLRRILQQKPDLQIIGTTHAPYLLDCVHPDEVHVLALDDSGYTRVRAFSSHPKAESIQRGTLYLSELWGALGESWVIPDASGSSA
jgi:predicted ATPase